MQTLLNGRIDVAGGQEILIPTAEPDASRLIQRGTEFGGVRGGSVMSIAQFHVRRADFAPGSEPGVFGAGGGFDGGNDDDSCIRPAGKFKKTLADLGSDVATSGDDKCAALNTRIDHCLSGGDRRGALENMDHDAKRQQYKQRSPAVNEHSGTGKGTSNVKHGFSLWLFVDICEFRIEHGELYACRTRHQMGSQLTFSQEFDIGGRYHRW
ncbi:MAG: hypothetical protein JWP89_1130 [Schlesneria sp.]|nr:hypothetical protein [Schlesneria sp.]